VQLERAQEADLISIVALVNRAYRGSGSDAPAWSFEAGLIEGDRTTLPLLRADLGAKPLARLMMHKDADSLLASVWLEPLDRGDWYLGLLAIRPDMQARGLGRLMLEASEAYVSAHGGARVIVSVLNVREGLIGWYERRGYTRTGKTDPYPYGDDRFGRPLREDLAFDVLAKPIVGPEQSITAGAMR